MKSLVIYFSNKEEVTKIAKAIATLTESDINRIKLYGAKDHVSYFNTFFSSFSNKVKKIDGDSDHPGNYQHIIFVTPYINGRLTPAITNYLVKYRNLIKSYSLITVSRFNKKKTDSDAKLILGNDPKIFKHFKYKELKLDSYDISDFSKI